MWTTCGQQLTKCGHKCEQTCGHHVANMLTKCGQTILINCGQHVDNNLQNADNMQTNMQTKVDNMWTTCGHNMDNIWIPLLKFKMAGTINGFMNLVQIGGCAQGCNAYQLTNHHTCITRDTHIQNNIIKSMHAMQIWVQRAQGRKTPPPKPHQPSPNNKDMKTCKIQFV